MGTQKQLIPVHHQEKANEARSFLRDLDIDVMARTLWGEARSEGKQGLEAVAHVILNRLRVAEDNDGTFWWGHSIVTICQRPYQFSCWNPGDPNREKLMAVDETDIHFATCLRVARRAVYGKLGADKTLGATHYHTIDIVPFWAKGVEPLVTIGRHIFYRLED